MTDGQVIILDNAGDDSYRQSSREYLTNPIRVDRVKIILESVAQLENVLKIKNFKSFGSESNRDISLKQYTSALDKTNLIIDIPLDPPVILDGQTYFQTEIEAYNEIDLVFEFEQAEIANYMK